MLSRVSDTPSGATRLRDCRHPNPATPQHTNGERGTNHTNEEREELVEHKPG